MILSERHGAGCDNLFIQNDAAAVINGLLKTHRGKVQLIYIDPPFNTGKKFQYRARIGEAGYRGKAAGTLLLDAYSDAQAGYEELLRSVLAGCRELLTPTGSIYVHLDYRAAPMARGIMDELFGPENFLNEIIWSYKSGGRSKVHYARKHDTILFYSYGKKYYFDIEAVGVPRGADVKNHMRRELDENGKVVMTIRSGGKVYTYSEDSLVYPSDVWSDISHLQQRDPERTGFETQKPEALLRRIILASSREGDIVADFFSGSGTTAAAAFKLGRRFIAADRSPLALQQLRKRLLSYCGDTLFASSVNTLFSWDPILQAYAYPCKLDCQRAGGRVNVTLADYMLPEAELCRVKGAGPLDFIDYWALGRVENDVFYPFAWQYRSLKTPELMTALQSPDCPGLCAHIVDAFSRQQFVML